MRSYLELVTRYLKAHGKKTRLTVISVAISVALVTGIFSMLDVFLRFEKLQTIHDKGNYHLAFKNTSEKERNAIGSRIDVAVAGRWKPLGQVQINGKKCELGGLDKSIIANLNIEIKEGQFPSKKNEIMLEQWAMESLRPDLKLYDTIEISLTDGSKRECVISGIYNDWGNMKAIGVPGVLMAIEGADEINTGKSELYIVLFKNGVKVSKAETEIKNTLRIADNRIGRNEQLLAVIGQGSVKAHGLYEVGAILFFLVLAAGVIMIYNTFNISVMERVRHFGLLRCIGASQAQIKKLVRNEGLKITLRAIPIGVLVGMLMTLFCSMVLKFYNKTLFSEVPVFTLSLTGIMGGIATGFLTVYIASALPAKKAAKVSPVNAVTGNSEINPAKINKRGVLTKILPVEAATGINNAVIKKRTLFLMSGSIALSIIMFLGFQVLVDFMHSSLKTTKPYTPDISLTTSQQGIDRDLLIRLGSIDGVKKAYGRMFGYVNAGDVRLISYDKNQLNWAKEDLLEGVLDENLMNKQNGIIAVVKENYYPRLGDKVTVNTPAGPKALKILGILRRVPFSETKDGNTFITSEKLFDELTGQSLYNVIDIQLKRTNQDQAIKTIKGMVGESITLLDQRQKNAEIDQTFFTMALFIYGFIAIIALISVLNLINTMNTSIAAKNRYLGMMRAVGMTGDQLKYMVLAEAATYSMCGALTGCILGIMLQRYLITNMLVTYHVIWEFPLVQLILIIIFTMLMTAVSVISPINRIKTRGISEVINSL